MALAHQDLLDPKQSKPSSLSDNIISTKAKVQFAQYHEKDEHNDGTNDDEHHESTFTLSEGSKSIASKSSSYRNIGLRSNLTRHIHGRDPLFHYEIVHVIGVGSMGSVVKVRKRPEALGGTARSDMVDSLKREKEVYDCIQIPFLRTWFHNCFSTMSKATHPWSSSRNILSPPPSFNDTTNNNTTPYSTSSLKYEVNYALKSIHLNHIADQSFVEELKNEIDILKKLDHPHIVRPMEVYQHQNQLFIVMELCAGGDLYSRDPYTEEDAARIVSCVLSAVSFMHRKNVVHRDLKFENIMFVNNSPRSEIKIIDFGLSKKYSHENKELTEGVGTIYTMAPEVMTGTYTSQADIWSVGVITYMLLSSQMPFYGQERQEIVEQIMTAQYNLNGRRWKRVSAKAKSFVEDLLVLDPNERLTGDAACASTWLNIRFAMTVRGPTDDELWTCIETFRKFVGYSKLKKLALMVIAHKSTAEEIGILRKVFQKFDTNKKDQLVFEEFKKGLTEYGFSDNELIHLFEGIDLDGTGIIRYTEFLAATIEAHGAIDEGRLAEAFDRLDSDDSGFISVDNLSSILGDQFPVDEINSILKESSLTCDNKVSYPEFLAMWEDHGVQTSKVSFVSKLPRLIDTDRSESSEWTGLKTTLSMDEDDNVDDDDAMIARVNYLSVKKYSQRRLEEAMTIEVNDALKLLYESDQKAELAATFPGTMVMMTVS